MEGTAGLFLLFIRLQRIKVLKRDNETNDFPPALSLIRVIMDRISTEHDPVLRQIDPEMLNSFSSSSQTLDFSSNFSRTNASNKHCENRLSLPEILSNIRSCRLQCFQPRLLNLQDSDSEECTSRKAGQTVNNKRVSAASVALLNTSKNGISGRQGFGCFWD